jgi:hypothetical protein
MRSSVLQNDKNGIIPFKALRYLQWLTSGYYGFSVFSSSLSAYSVSSVVETSRARWPSSGYERSPQRHRAHGGLTEDSNYFITQSIQRGTPLKLHPKISTSRAPTGPQLQRIIESDLDVRPIAEGLFPGAAASA